MTPQTAQHATTIQLVVFSLGVEQYALPIEHVQEIIRYTQPRSVNTADPSIRGVISLRGKIIPVCDLGDRLANRAERGENGNIIVIDADERSVGVIVDEVNEVMTIDRAQIEPLPTDAGDLVDGIAKLDDRLIILLNPDQTVQQ